MPLSVFAYHNCGYHITCPYFVFATLLNIAVNLSICLHSCFLIRILRMRSYSYDFFIRLAFTYFDTERYNYCIPFLGIPIGLVF